MKKILIWLFIVIFTLFLGAGCKVSTETAAETTAAETTAAETTAAETTAAEEAVEEIEPFTVGFSNGPITHAWRTQMIQDVQRDFALYQGMGWVDELIIQHAGFDVDLQINQIRNLVNAGVELLIIDPNSSTALDPVIEEAVDAGVLVLVADQYISSDVAYQIPQDGYLWITDQANWVLEKMGGKGDLVHMSGIAGQPTTTDRDLAVETILKDYPDINLLAKVQGNWDPAAAQQAMADTLAAFPNIDGIITEDGQPTGIFRAFEAAGREVPIMNADYMASTLEWWIANMENGFESFTVLNSPGFYSNICLGVGLRMLRGWELPDDFWGPDELHNITTPTVAHIPTTDYITQDNVKDVYDEHIKTRGVDVYVDKWPSQEEINSWFKTTE